MLLVDGAGDGTGSHGRGPVRPQAEPAQPYPVRCAAMSSTGLTTRFAPSPTGSLHLGNARTALFSFLAARAARWSLRAAHRGHRCRTQPAGSARPAARRIALVRSAVGRGPRRRRTRMGPIGRANARTSTTRRSQSSPSAELTYPCFCTPEELQLSRRAQLAAGRPPRYARTCLKLLAAEVQARTRCGQASARSAFGCRTIVPSNSPIGSTGRSVSGRDDIGDFVVCRADGSAAFFLSNALDDSAMGITLVLRGEDHLANTPRQLLILEALGRPDARIWSPAIAARAEWQPAFEARGSRQPDATCTRKGISPARCVIISCASAMPAPVTRGSNWTTCPRISTSRRTSHSAARFDETQLRHWQREAITRATPAAIEQWLGARLDALGNDPVVRESFVKTVKGNLMLPADADSLIAVVTQDADRSVARSDCSRSLAAGADVLRCRTRAASARIRTISRPGLVRSRTRRDAKAPDSSCRCGPR